MEAVGDRTFYVASYAGFCLALLLPTIWFIWRASRKR